MIADEIQSTDAILDAFATAVTVTPRGAMREAVARWDELGPVLLDILREAGTSPELSPRTEAILYYGSYLMAHVRDTRAFAPLCRLCSRPGEIDGLIGDIMTDDLPWILARTYDGDPGPLRALIEAETADAFVRHGALEALAWLTATSVLDRGDTEQYLRDLFTSLRPQGSSPVWIGWQQAIALLGLVDLVPLVENVFERGFIDDSVMELADFHTDFREAREAASPIEAFSDVTRNMCAYDDLEELLSTWTDFSPSETYLDRAEPSGAPLGEGRFPEDRSLLDDDSTIVPKGMVLTYAGARNPLRDVGRNDACPCGSGKKFKKCCLDDPASPIWSTPRSPASLPSYDPAA